MRFELATIFAEVTFKWAYSKEEYVREPFDMS
jgi:hypothetical protein